MTIIPYHREKAAEYAHMWAYSRNPAFYDFSNLGGNCTNFVSQCLTAGGMPYNYNYLGWFFKNLKNRSPSFTGAPYLYNFLVQTQKRRGPFAQEIEVIHAQIGDIIQLTFDGVKFSHSMIVIKAGADPLVAANSYDVYGKPLSEYYYYNSRALHILGAYA